MVTEAYLECCIRRGASGTSYGGTEGRGTFFAPCPPLCSEIDCTGGHGDTRGDATMLPHPVRACYSFERWCCMVKSPPQQYSGSGIPGVEEH